MNIGKRIRKEREGQGMTQKELGEAIDLGRHAQVYISRYESGGHISKRDIKKISEVLGIDLTRDPMKERIEKQNEQVATQRVLDYLDNNYTKNIKEIAYDCKLTTDIVETILEREDIDLEEHYYKNENIAVKMINSLIDTIELVVNIRNKNYKEIGRKNYETQDFLHALEFVELEDRDEFIKEFREMRLERRRMKNQNKLLEPLYDFIEDNKQLKSQLSNIKKEIEKLEKIVSNQRYTPRERDEMFPDKERLTKLKEKVEMNNAS